MTLILLVVLMAFALLCGFLYLLYRENMQWAMRLLEEQKTLHLSLLETVKSEERVPPPVSEEAGEPFEIISCTYKEREGVSSKAPRGLPVNEKHPEARAEGELASLSDQEWAVLEKWAQDPQFFSKNSITSFGLKPGSIDSFLARHLLTIDKEGTKFVPEPIASLLKKRAQEQRRDSEVGETF